MKTAALLTPFMIALALLFTSAQARRGAKSSFVRRTPTPAPSRSSHGCLKHPMPVNDGPWDTESDYTTVIPGVEANQYCGGLDVCFAIDESGSMAATNFNREIALVRSTIASLVKRSHPDFPSCYSAWLFDGTSFGPGDLVSPATTDYAAILNNLQNHVRYDGGCTNITAGLLNCQKELTGNAAKQKVLVLISDGAQTVDSNGDQVFRSTEDDRHVLSIADQIKNQGTTIIAVELFSRAVGPIPFLTKFLKRISSVEKRSGNPRYFSGQFEAVFDGRMAADLSGATCDEEVVVTPTGLIRGTCPCSSNVADVGLVALLKTPPEENNGVALCTVRPAMAPAAQKNVSVTMSVSDAMTEEFVCDSMATELACFVDIVESWNCVPETLDGDTCECHLQSSGRAVPVSMSPPRQGPTGMIPDTTG